jgi:CRP/FNR family transcriptional regulator, cyclic AMP receptor protein
MDEARQLLTAHFPQLDWSRAPWARLTPLWRLRRVSAGSVVVAQGAPCPALFGVLSGAIEARFLGADGEGSVIEHTAAGRLFGLAAFVTGQPSAYEALAVRPTRLLLIGAPAYVLLMDELPGFARALMAEFAQRYQGTLLWYAAARHQGAMERLSLALAQLQREQPDAPCDARGWRGLRSTQAGLAELAGLTRQTVNELLARLQAQGRVRTAYGRLWLAPGLG